MDGALKAGANQTSVQTVAATDATDFEHAAGNAGIVIEQICQRSAPQFSDSLPATVRCSQGCHAASQYARDFVDRHEDLSPPQWRVTHQVVLFRKCHLQALRNNTQTECAERAQTRGQGATAT